VLDRSSRQVHWGSAKVDLTALEFSVVEYLMLHAGEVVTRTRIYEHVWNEQMEVMSNVIDVHIKEIRRKLARVGGEQVIQTVRGAGYSLTRSTESEP
jgi:DNA-binding response OmpR family regulator